MEARLGPAETVRLDACGADATSVGVLSRVRDALADDAEAVHRSVLHGRLLPLAKDPALIRLLAGADAPLDDDRALAAWLQQHPELASPTDPSLSLSLRNGRVRFGDGVARGPWSVRDGALVLHLTEGLAFLPTRLEATGLVVGPPPGDAPGWSALWAAPVPRCAPPPPADG